MSLIQPSGAFELARPESWPSRRTEDWRWTDVRRWLRSAPPPSPPLPTSPGGPFAAVGGSEVAFSNGHAAGLEAGSDIRVEGAATIRLRFVTQAQGTGHECQQRLELAAGADLLLLESYEGGGAAYVASTRLEIIVGPGARLTRVVLAEDAADAISLSRADIRLNEGSRLNQLTLASGARLQRLETRVAHPGRGAEAILDAVYAVGAERHADMTTQVRHFGPDGRTRQLAKGVVAGGGRAVFQGRIVVEAGADRTDARMGHHALMLSDRAEVDAKPELEIYADEVACAHGNTVGALDREALFYAMSRGLPESEARALLTQAFLNEALERLEPGPVKDLALEWSRVRLGTLG